MFGPDFMHDRIQLFVADRVNIDFGLTLASAFGQLVESALPFFKWRRLQAAHLLFDGQHLRLGDDDEYWRALRQARLAQPNDAILNHTWITG